MQRGRLGALSWGEQQTWAVAADLEMREKGGRRAAGAWHAFLGERCLWRGFTGTSQSGVFSVPLHPALDSEFPKEANALAISLEVLTVKARAATGGCPASLVQTPLSSLRVSTMFQWYQPHTSPGLSDSIPPTTQASYCPLLWLLVCTPGLGSQGQARNSQPTDLFLPHGWADKARPSSTQTRLGLSYLSRLLFFSPLQKGIFLFLATSLPTFPSELLTLHLQPPPQTFPSKVKVQG